MNKFHLTLTPDWKELFQKKLDRDQITATAFVRYYLNELRNERIDPETFEQIRNYQDQNPGLITDLTDYIMINLNDDEHKSLFLNKLTLKILPQHFLRFFVEKYCNEGLSNEIILKIQEFILKRGPKGKKGKRKI